GCMSAMPGTAVDGAAFDAHLRPAGQAVRAATAAGIVMHHDAGADPRDALIDLGYDRRHDPAWLVPGDDRTAYVSETKRRGAAGGAIELEIAAAHAGSLDFDDHLPGSRGRIGELGQLQFALAKESHAAHGLSP